MVILDETNKEEFFRELVRFIELGQIELFRKDFFDLHVYEQTEFFQGLNEEDQNRLFQFLSPEEMADIFQHLPIKEQKIIFGRLEPTYASAMLAQMYVDDAADFLGELEVENQDQYLKLLNVEEAKEIKSLLNYAEDTAGGLMTTEYVAIPAFYTVQQVIMQLKKEAPNAETVYYLYVVDEEHRLVGVCSLRDLIIADSSALIKDIMSEHVVSVYVGLDQEKVADIVQKYDFLALPVIDEQERLVGIVTVDDVMDVMSEEATEDISKLSAINGHDLFDTNSFESAKRRLPWLIMLLFIGMGTATIIGHFQATLQQVTILAVFIPLIGGTGGNAGTQALAVVVRGLSIGEWEKKDLLHMLRRELGTGLITGTVAGLMITLITYFWQGNPMLGLVVGLSLFCTLVVSTLSGATIPILIQRLKIDPAVASGPFITTINDIVGMMIYFGIATLFMKFLL
ncbi:MAG: magnesium transporter [Tepidibacillus sp.]